MADGTCGLRVIYGPFNSWMFEVGFCDLPPYPSGVAVSDSYAYVANYAGLQVLNVTNHQPYVTGSCATPGSAYGVDVSGSYAFVADGNRGLRVIDVSNPSQPFEAGYYDTQDTSYDVTVNNNLAYLADGHYLGIYQYSGLPSNPWPDPLLPPSFALYYATPNPFNASTALSYQLSINNHVNLRVYDTAGRLVSTLVNERQLVGTHTATFDGTGLASGIYLAKLQTGEFTAVQKMVLLK